MATNKGQEFEIKIAKAKDLPLSWFDLVLRPEKFKQHIKTLEDNPNIEPTGLQLVATFLEKGGVLEGQVPLPVPEGGRENMDGGAVLEERRQRLVNCALFIGSFMQWDLALFEKSLPPAVSYSLLVQLTKHYPLSTRTPPQPPNTEEEEEEEEEETHLLRESPATLMAHVLYSHWVVRFLTLSHLPPDIRRSTNTWDISCATPEQIKSLLEPKLTECVSFLEEVSLHCRCYRVPSVAVSLPVMGRRTLGQEDTVQLCLPSTGRDLPISEILCQIYYSLGCHYFWHDDISRAHSRFKRCTRQLSLLSVCPSLVDQAQLRGLECACVQVRQKRRVAGENSEREDEDEEEDVEERGLAGGTLLEKLEHCRISDIEGVPDQLIQDLCSPSIPLSTCTALHRDLASRAEDGTAEPLSKRARLDHSLGSSLPVHTQVAVCNGVRASLDGHPVQPQFWRLFLSPNTDPTLYLFLFHVCSEAIGKKGQESKTRTLKLQTLLRSVCCKSSEPEKVWEMLLNSPAKSLATQQDTELMHRLFPAKSSSPQPVGSFTAPYVFSPSASLSVVQEKNILSATSCQDLLDAVDKCFKSLPTSEHKTLAQKWVGPGDEFMNFDLISDPVLLTKYNAMVQKARQLKRAQCYAESIKFLRGALGLIPRPSGSNSSESHSIPEQAVLELILWVELKAAVMETRQHSPHEVARRFVGLIDRAKNLCQRSYSTSHHDRFDAMTVCMASAFLLNTHYYHHLIACDHPITPGKVAPRVAIAALAMKEDRDARKSVRDLFSAVLGVFSTPVASGSESRSEIEHKQLQLRSQFDVLVENLDDTTSLSLLLMALVRIWSIVKKPEEEIRLQTEHAMYWPTVIGSPGSVNADHVFRTLLSTLHHSLTVHPHNDSWMVLEGEIHYATGKHGAALLSYLKAGALTSRHFEDEVPAIVWPAQVYRKIINCCTNLNLHTHAVLFCQLLVPVDYELAFSILSNHSSSMVESYFSYFWDMVVIEYLIYINAKRGEKYKQSIAVQMAGQPELNCNNSPEVLARAAQVRRRKLLQSFYDQSFSTL